jgi:diketogulonate reductase-like aldo/keto reductase
MYFNIFTIPKISNQERVIENSKSVDEEEGKLTDKYMEDINKTFAVFDKDNSLEMI